MQSRRRDEYLAVSPSVKVRTSRYEVGPGQFPGSSHDDGAGLSPGGRNRSSSPQRQGGLRRSFDGCPGSGSVEREEHGWGMGIAAGGGGVGGGMTERVRSRSPSHRGGVKRPLNEEDGRGKLVYDYDGCKEFDRGDHQGGVKRRLDAEVLRGKHAYDYDGSKEFERGDHQGGVQRHLDDAVLREKYAYDYDGLKEFDRGDHQGRVKRHLDDDVSRGKRAYDYDGSKDFNRGEYAEHKDFDKQKYVESMDIDTRSKAKLRHDYVYDGDYGTHGYNDGMNNHDSRMLAVEKHGMPLQKPVTLEEDNMRGLYKSHFDLSSTSNCRQNAGQQPLSTSGVDVGRSEHKSIGYQDTSKLDYIPVRGGDNKSLHPGHDSYNVMPMSYSEDFVTSSSRNMQRGHHDPYLSDMPLPPDEYLRKGVKIREPIGNHDYYQRPLDENVRYYESARDNDMTYYQRGPCRHGRRENIDYHYPNLCEGSSEYREYPPNDAQGMMPLTTRGDYDHTREYPPNDVHGMMPPTARKEYDHSREYPPNDGHGVLPPTTRADYDNRDFMTTRLMQSTYDPIEKPDCYIGDTRKSNMSEYRMDKPLVSDYPVISKMRNVSRRHVEHINSGFPYAKFQRRGSQDYERTTLSQDNQISHLRSDLHIGRDAHLEIEKDRSLKISPLAKYGSEMHRFGGRSRQMEEELGFHELSDRMSKRNYSMEEDVIGYNDRGILLTKYNDHGYYDNPYDDEDWSYEDYNEAETRNLYLDRTSQHGYNKDYRDPEVSYERQERHDHFTSHGWNPSLSSMKHSRNHSARVIKHDHKYIKPYPKLGFSNRQKSYRSSRQNEFHKSQTSWKGANNFHEGKTYNDDVLDVSDNAVGSDPSEQSEEFKKMVHEAFLTFSRRLNTNPSIRERYTEPGKADPLICIVCRRSCSKEFLDTRGLAMHAFMSHKTGLRVDHLGLHKAICVLMGWDSDATPDTVTWVPRLLSSAEALAQKEDLIIWPPIVIVQNISLLNNGPEEQKIITPEKLEAFLRGKRFVDGKIRVCLGKPADKSIMLVKFLNTFTELGSAENVHQYFAENNRGRVDFERRISKNGGNSSSSCGARLQSDEVEELFLYGYMGISEDLHKIDFKTKETAVIKSKKEIQNLANDPVRSEAR